MRFTYPYQGVSLLWEVIKETAEGTLCVSVDGIRGGLRYFGCGAQILMPSSQVERLTEGEMLRDSSAQMTIRSVHEDTRRHSRRAKQTCSGHEGD